jgi:protein-S-isoprenylcysteine O-methyltransferase Ste14
MRVDTASRRASLFLGSGYAISIGAAIIARLIASSAALPGPIERWVALGFGVAIFATALRGWSIITLGCLFDRDALLHTDHVLVRGGPYRFVRHPAYAANVVFASGVGLIVVNWASLVVATLGALLAHTSRIRFEETLLTQRFADDYRTYAQEAGRLVPRLSTGRSVVSRPKGHS